jgi:hypothetical protein
MCAEEMECFLFKQGWNTLEKIDTGDFYFIKAVKR